MLRGQLQICAPRNPESLFSSLLSFPSPHSMNLCTEVTSASETSEAMSADIFTLRERCELKLA